MNLKRLCRIQDSFEEEFLVSIPSDDLTPSGVQELNNDLDSFFSDNYQPFNDTESEYYDEDAWQYEIYAPRDLVEKFARSYGAEVIKIYPEGL